MAGAAYQVRIKGLKELNRALGKVNKEAKKTVQSALKEAAEPVRVRAEKLAVIRISHVGETWSRMRIGATVGTIYVAPQARRRGGSPRPNLGHLLFEQAMFPALEQKKDDVIHEVEKALDKLGRQAGF